jgi:TolA-binding protein
VLWTPTVLIMDPNGAERVRSEGYVPKAEFRAWLEMGLARLSFLAMNWDEAEAIYNKISERYPQTVAAPEAIYWRGVSRYKKNDHEALGQTADLLAEKYPGNLWTSKASVWAG